jgi:hypothetical protein
VCVGVGVEEGDLGPDQVESRLACLVRSRGDPEGQSGNTLKLGPDYTETDTLLRDTKNHRPKSRSSSSCNAAASCGERGLEGSGRRSV